MGHGTVTLQKTPEDTQVTSSSPSSSPSTQHLVPSPQPKGRRKVSLNSAAEKCQSAHLSPPASPPRAGDAHGDHGGSGHGPGQARAVLSLQSHCSATTRETLSTWLQGPDPALRCHPDIWRQNQKCDSRRPGNLRRNHGSAGLGATLTDSLYRSHTAPRHGMGNAVQRHVL